MKQLKNFIVRHLPTGGLRRHVGYVGTLLSCGEISVETCAQAHYVPPLEWVLGEDYEIVREGDWTPELLAERRAMDTATASPMGNPDSSVTQPFPTGRWS